MPELSFWVPGHPRPAGSKTAFRTKGGRTVVVDASGKQGKDWRNAVRDAALAAMSNEAPTRAPIALLLVFSQTRPKSHLDSKGQVKPRYAAAIPTGRPDASKLLRSVEDSLSGIIYCDDTQCFDVRSVKQYGDRPGVLVKATWDEYPPGVVQG